MGFYDYKGYWRNDGDGFYDAKGNWVNPGCGFYDSKGYFRTANNNSSVVTVKDDTGIGSGIFIIFAIIGIFGMLVSNLIEWITGHLYVVFVGFVIINVVLTFIMTISKKHKGIKFLLSYLGNYVCVISFIYIILIYAVPSVVINDESIGNIFEFILMVVLGAGSVTLVQFFNFYHEKAILEFIIGIIFFVL